MTFEEEVREKLEAVLSKGKKPEDTCGGTSVRCATGVILGVMEGVTQLSTREAWKYLDRENVALVHDLMLEYGDRVARWGKP